MSSGGVTHEIAPGELGADDGAASDAMIAAALLAVDPGGLRGAVVRAPADVARDTWLMALRACLAPSAPWIRSPAQPDEAALIGGLDLAATLAEGRPRHVHGLLARAQGGVLLMPMAERLPASAAALLAQVMETGLLPEAGANPQAEPDNASSFDACVIALDEGEEDETTPAVMRETLGLHLDLHGLRSLPSLGEIIDAAQVVAARELLATVETHPELPQALVQIAGCLGIDSIRPVLFALRAARANAALAGRRITDDSDLALAARLVLAPRATRTPITQASSTPPPPPEPAPEPAEGEASSSPARETAELPEDLVLAAVASALGPDVLAQLAASVARRARAHAGGRGGASHRSGQRGRPLPARRAIPRRGERLDLVATLKSAAPWQRFRALKASNSHHARRYLIHKDDLHIRRYRQHSRTTTLFVVDASGSAALHRLAEAKGAVELLLAECYVRRDEVALIAFRGRGSETLLPPTRSLVRARRCLAALPGGGATPLAAAIESAGRLALDIRRRGTTPVVVFFTDGRANLALDGTQGREAGDADAERLARHFAEFGIRSLLIDTSPRPAARAAELAARLGADYLPLPYADAHRVAATVALRAR